MASLGHPCKFQRVSRLGIVTARHSSSGRQPSFAALNRGRLLYSAGRPSRWALADISSLLFYCSRSCLMLLVHLFHCFPPLLLPYSSECSVARWRNGYSIGLAINRSWVQILLGATLCNNLGQVVHTYVSLSPSSITWYWPEGGDALRPTAWWMTYGHLRADCLYTGISSGPNAQY